MFSAIRCFVKLLDAGCSWWWPGEWRVIHYFSWTCDKITIEWQSSIHPQQLSCLLSSDSEQWAVRSFVKLPTQQSTINNQQSSPRRWSWYCSIHNRSTTSLNYCGLHLDRWWIWGSLQIAEKLYSSMFNGGKPWQSMAIQQWFLFWDEGDFVRIYFMSGSSLNSQCIGLSSNKRGDVPLRTSIHGTLKLH